MILSVLVDCAVLGDVSIHRVRQAALGCLINAASLVSSISPLMTSSDWS